MFRIEAGPPRRFASRVTEVPVDQRSQDAVPVVSFAVALQLMRTT
jgi:hypothetical protein